MKKGEKMGNYTNNRGEKIDTNDIQDKLKENALERNFDEEKAETEDIYLEMIYPREHDEYLVDGAILTCSKLDKNPQVYDGRIYLTSIPNCYTTLHVTENTKAMVGRYYQATIQDCKINKNIVPFCCNCENPPYSKEEKARLLSDHLCESRGTCRALMDLNDAWENFPSKVPYFNFIDDEKGLLPGINMTSVLFCRHGGLIYPVSSGQEFDVQINRKVALQDSTRLLIMKLEGRPFITPRINSDGSFTAGYGYDFTKDSDPESFARYFEVDDYGNIQVKRDLTEQEVKESIDLAADKKGITQAV